jgi:hypothetical protein
MRLTIPKLLYASATEGCFSPFIFFKILAASRKLDSASLNYSISQLMVPKDISKFALSVSLLSLLAYSYATS